MMRHALLFVLALIASTAAQAAPPAPPPAPPWQAEHLRDAPLVGRIWHVGEARYATPDEALAILAGSDVVALGEKHDNPDHHRLQAWVVDRLADMGRAPAVAMEMITADKDAALAAYLAAPNADAAGLGAAVDWGTSGWPDWALYAPIVAPAVDRGLPVLAANPPEAVTDALTGGEPLNTATRAKLGLDRPLSEADRDALYLDIRDSHCNALPETFVPKMAEAQRAKDGHMARVTLGALDRPGVGVAVLITGGMHARADRGVPLSIRRFSPETTVKTLGFVEVSPEDGDPAAYAASYNAPALPFDLVWFTPRVDIEDPCAKFADQIEALKNKGTGHGKN